MKYNNDYYMQVTRRIVNDEACKSLSVNAKWLYIVLKELEQRFCNGRDKRNIFTRSDPQLATDTGMSLATLKRAKAELSKTDLVIFSVGLYDGKGRCNQRITSYEIRA